MSALQVHSDYPLCAGPEPETLIDEYVTPIALHYVRNHGPVPAIDQSAYRLVIDGLVRHPNVNLCCRTAGTLFGTLSDGDAAVRRQPA